MISSSWDNQRDREKKLGVCVCEREKVWLSQRRFGIRNWCVFVWWSASTGGDSAMAYPIEREESIEVEREGDIERERERAVLTLSLRGDICAMSAAMSGDCLTSWLWLWLWLGCGGCNISCCDGSPSALSELLGLPPIQLLLPAVISELRRLIKLILSRKHKKAKSFNCSFSVAKWEINYSSFSNTAT